MFKFRIKHLSRVFLCSLSLATLIFGCNQSVNNETVNLEEGFVTPPNTAKPRVWWHWMNGNITQEGIRKDLAWMNRIGIGGFQNFDAAFNTPQVVDNRLTYMTPEWKDAFYMTTHLADSLGLEMAIAGSPGWSESGGPWVPASEGMKKMVWSETIVDGGQNYSGTLPHPPTSSGSFQNIGSEGRGMTVTEGEQNPIPEYYADAEVIAYKVPDADYTLSELNAKVTSSGGDFTLEMLTDGDLQNSKQLPHATNGKSSWIQFEFDQPQSISSISMVGGGSGGGMFSRGASSTRVLESSNDGNVFSKVIDITSGGVSQNTLTFTEVTAKYFRVSISTPQNSTPFSIPGIEMGAPAPAARGTEIAEIVLHTVPRITQFEQKAGFSTLTNVEDILTPEIEHNKAIQPQDVINITDRMSADGTLNWNVPAGRWKVIRMGYSLTGHQNSPASPEATGLEVDKLNPEYVRNYFTNYLDQYKDATGGLMGEKGLQYIITDSWEAGTANWTDKMIEEFNVRNNYDITPWLPVLTGKIVESSEASEKFLWDYRNTLEEMVAEYHYDELSSILKERGMGRYTESHENGRAFIGDGMEIKKNAAIPMSATWTPGGMAGMDPDVVMIRHATDIRESASVAHIYGQNLVAAESLTAIGNSWGYSPGILKPTADFMLASGLNRFVIHTSVHQPLDDKIPGIGLGPFGQWFTRHETWGEQAKPWVDYLARSSYMLQQGKFVADVLYIYGQGHNLTALFGSELPPVPEGYNYDYLNAGAVDNVLSVENEKITTESGMEYSLLALDESTRYMTLPILKKLDELVGNGANIVGPRPISTPSLKDDDAEFQNIVEKLWGDGNGVKKVGKGKVYAGLTIDGALNDLGVVPDFTYSKTNNKSDLQFVHRNLGDQDIYWLRTKDSESSVRNVSFRVSGKVPEIWNPVSGEMSQASYSIEDGRTNVTLNMDPEDALFIVFKDDASVKSFHIETPQETELTTLSGEWNVSFQAERGAPASAVFSELAPWNESEDEGIKYFSGTASYSKTINIPDQWISEGSEIVLDLGEVENLAEVIVNGVSQGIVWKKPFKVSISDALQLGENQVEVKVTNLWVNRLIGDQQAGIVEKITYTTHDFYQAGSPLKTSGLLGPVKILQK